MASPPHPVSVHPAALVQTEHLQVFSFYVRWSDGGETLVHKSWDEFRGLHKTLKETFPVEAGLLRRSDRVLPKFPGAPLLLLRGRMGRSLERLQRLGTYLLALLAAESLSRSPALGGFFAPTSQDLESALSPGSLVILPVPTEAVASPRACSLEGGSLRCLHPYSTQDARGRLFRSGAGEVLDVLLRHPSGWWLVANEEQQMAWFPAPYLEQAAGQGPKGGQLWGCRASQFCVSRAYNSGHSDELSVPAGARVCVLETSDRGWWWCRYGECEGLLPAALLRPDQLGVLLSPAALFRSACHEDEGESRAPEARSLPPSVPARPSPGAVRRSCCTITRRALGRSSGSPWRAPWEGRPGVPVPREEAGGRHSNSGCVEGSTQA
ncbi:NADPH oxidase organizer 1 isoform X1 [Erinaceus europaeus]|uniref:NADPH oxidase organizer 1 isoform X1 n=1 Tax=Erinaceus europaeus TaxID=9365 RepID=A0ABM3VWA1_ERIEU|nr:NADPH oxidase organizer 1 isoform X1 [Erinaceus europaeus]